MPNADSRRGGGLRAVILPPPPPAVLVSAEITHHTEENGTVFYHMKVTSVTNQTWSLRRRYSAFHALYESLRRFHRFATRFPGKKPIRTLFNRVDVEERMSMLKQWMTEAVNLEIGIEPIRSPLQQFLATPNDIFAAIPAQQRVPGPMTIQVAMPVEAVGGQELEVEHLGVVFAVPAPDNAAPGSVFTVELPEEDDSGTAMDSPIITATPISEANPFGEESAVTTEPPLLSAPAKSDANPF
eukprot:CAMPEP_0185759886 /NCGR_PEP_ID=MMETSP1174-20130828/18691_1 /TAXON_ID=35687 /ORGANISM="Dictyocha speculum, Strain CCMP1381" /LENGTH=240 /DNA_ID=CAMNT_0028440445 /DNA_START=191 /DNA_END=913 /DNA_ORIENTATION=+